MDTQVKINIVKSQSQEWINQFEWTANDFTSWAICEEQRNHADKSAIYDKGLNEIRRFQGKLEALIRFIDRE